MAVLTCNFLSKCLGRMVSFHAIIPSASFGDMLHPNSTPYADVKPFKTLYLLHGIGGNDSDWLMGSRVAHYAEAHRLAVIMPAGENGFYTDTSSAHQYGEYVGRELVAATRSMFNLSHERDDTYIGGLSMGGYGALRNGLKYSDTFSKIVALSSALVMEDAPKSTSESFWPFGKRDYFERVFGDLDQLDGSDFDVYALATKCAANVHIYSACGTEDTLLDKNRRFAEHLRSLGANCTYEEGPGGHDWPFWDQYIHKAIRWIFSV